MAVFELYAVIEGKPAGILRQDQSGLITFQYADNYEGVALSLSMPISNRRYPQSIVRPYLFGLLPDSEEQRRAIAREYGGRPNNPVAMLAHIGLDCPGAIQFCPANLASLVNVIREPASYELLNDHEIAIRLKSLADGNADSWHARDEHWSLGGNQGKFALAWHGGTWCSCHGSAATTHIFKNGVTGYMLQALNEYVCMSCAKRCGLRAATVSYRFFEDEPALIVKRYDREELGGKTIRHHFEDLCQSLSVMPDMKYTSDGGPSTYDVLKLLASTGEHAASNLRDFTSFLFYNCLIGAPDAHAKNYSLALSATSDAVIAPLYDVASALAYEGMSRTGRLAMAIGGENRFGRVGRGAVARYAAGGSARVGAAMESAGLDGDACKAIMADLAVRIPREMEQVFDESAHIPGAEELRGHLLGPVQDNCATTLALL